MFTAILKPEDKIEAHQLDQHDNSAANASPAENIEPSKQFEASILAGNQNHTPITVNATPKKQKYIELDSRLLPLCEAANLLNTSNAEQQELNYRLVMLHNELEQQLHNKIFHNDIAIIAQGIKEMVLGILNPNLDSAAKISCIEAFELKVTKLPLLKQSILTKVFKILIGVLLACIGAAFGAMIGVVIEGAILSMLSVPAGGSAGIIGVIQGAIHGSITGWAVGLMAAITAGCAGSTKLSMRFLGRTTISAVTDTAADVARNQSPQHT